MSKNDETNTESSKSSEEQTLREELIAKDRIISALEEANNYRNQTYYRMALVQAINTAALEMHNLGERLSLMVNKISNQNKILAASLNVEIE